MHIKNDKGGLTACMTTVLSLVLLTLTYYTLFLASIHQRSFFFVRGTPIKIGLDISLGIRIGFRKRKPILITATLLIILYAYICRKNNYAHTVLFITS